MIISLRLLPLNHALCIVINNIFKKIFFPVHSLPLTARAEKKKLILALIRNQISEINNVMFSEFLIIVVVLFRKFIVWFF